MRTRTLLSIIIILLVMILISGWWFLFGKKEQNQLTGTPIKIGILHSLSGTMMMEKSLVDSILLAVEEINNSGGILGRPIEPIVIDGHSDWKYMAEQADRLINQEKVSVIFACWTSSCRKTVKPIIEKNHFLMMYPLQYEGLEESPNIVYTGPAPNQQIIPAVKWSIDNIGKKFFLVGSDYVYPRTANAIVSDYIKAMGGQVLGEEYAILGSSDVSHMIQKIKETKPDVIINNINGDTNVSFFRELRAAGILPSQIPTISLSISEDVLHNYDSTNMVGDYSAWNYFQSIDSAENNSFVKNFKKKFGNYRVVDAPMQNQYYGVYLWARAVKAAGTEKVSEVLKAIKKQGVLAPEGLVNVDPSNNHTWHRVRIAKIQANGQFNIIWSSEHPIKPVPYPTSRSKAEWDRFLQEMYTRWGNNWNNPAEKPTIIEPQNR